MLAVALLLWPNAARVIRSQVLTLAQRQFVEAARFLAEIVDVRETASGALPTAEQEILGEGDAEQVAEVEDDDR